MGPEELGRQLRRARQHRGLSLRDLHAITAIPLPCLAALEEGHLDQLPSPVYARGYVRSYAEAVRLDGDRLALELWRAAPAAPTAGKAPAKKAARQPSSLAPLRQSTSPFVPKEGRVRLPRPPGIGRPKAGRLNLKTKHRRQGAPARLRALAPILERAAIVVLVLVLAAGLWSLVRGNPSPDKQSGTRASQVVSPAPPASSPSSAPPITAPAPPPSAAPVSDNGSQATYALGRGQFTVAVAATDAPLWIEARSGPRGAQLFMGTLQPGESKPFPTTGLLWVRLGNLAHSAVTVDGGPTTLPAKPALPYNLLFQS